MTNVEAKDGLESLPPKTQIKKQNGPGNVLSAASTDAETKL